MNNGQAASKGNVLRYLCDDQWSNNACCGYALIAYKAIGHSDDQVHDLISALNDAFGNYTVDEAKRKYEKHRI